MSTDSGGFDTPPRQYTERRHSTTDQLGKTKRTFGNHIRRIIQCAATLLYNADIRQWGRGTISRSPLKRICVPGLNCYSCPAAVAGCPLGALQNSVGAGRFPLLVTGILVLCGTLLGRMVCGFLCPVGLVQELLYKIKSRKVEVHRSATLLAVTRRVSLAKYVILSVMCVAVPLLLYVKDGIGAPLFCKYICPAGTIGAGVPLVIANDGLRQAVGRHFVWKCSVAASFIVWSVFWFRPFCVFACPLGAVYSLFNKVALFGPVVDSTKCIHCGKCAAVCKMPTPAPSTTPIWPPSAVAFTQVPYNGAVNDRECIRCGECQAVCPTGAISIYGNGRRRPFFTSA